MRFSDIENIENLVSSPDLGLNSFHQEMLSEYIDKENRKSIAKQNPFNYFYEDVIASDMLLDFKTILGESYYKIATDDALTCINICDNFYKLSSWTVSGWLQNALKFTDTIVLHYIQFYLNEIPKTFHNSGIEKARYSHLMEKKGDIAVAGALLKELYDFRNKLEHRTIVHPDGKQELVAPQRNLVRQFVVKHYPDVLKRILKSYS